MKNTKTPTGNNIPIFNAKAEFMQLKKELHQALDEVGERGQWILGPSVEQFEAELQSYTKSKAAISCASGTDAITLALVALGLKPTDEVLVPANCYPSVFGVSAAGVTVKLVDVDPNTGLIDPKKVEKAVTKKTKAILAVHLYGNVCNLTALSKIAKTNRINLIEDCAQAFGATYRNKAVGTIGIAGTFSFYPTKNIGALGDGGAITTSSATLAKKIKQWRMYGETSRYQSQFPGKNSRLDEIQAAFLSIKLKHVKTWLAARTKQAAQYDKGLKDIPYIQLIKREVGAAPHLYVIRTKHRTKLIKHLTTHGIGTLIHYPTPIHKTPAYSHIKGLYPNAEVWSQEVLSLPFYPQLSAEQINQVIESIASFNP